MFFPCSELPLVAVFISGVHDFAFAMEKPPDEGSLVGGAVTPLEKSLPFLLPSPVLSHVFTFVILLHAFTLGLLIAPATSIGKTSHLI